MKKTEKTTQKNPVQYGRTKQADVNKFFQKKKPAHSDDEDVDCDSSDSDVEQSMYHGADDLGVYQPINPIDTILGPIGEFLPKPGVFPRHPSVGLFGKRRTGKTYTLRWIMYNCFRDYNFGIVLTNTRINGFWQKYVPSDFVFQGLDQMAMQRLVERQKSMIEKWKEKHPRECAKNPDAYKEADELRAFVIFDDVISDKVAMQWNEFINSFFVEGRHLCISVFITTQHVKGIGPMLRGNLDVAILQPIFQHEARMTLADLYAGFMDRQTFMTLMDQVVKDEPLPDSTPQEPKKFVRTFVINDYENTPNAQVKFKWLVSENPDDIEPNWHLCHDEYWKQQKNNFNRQTKKGRDPIDTLDDLRSTMF